MKEGIRVSIISAIITHYYTGIKSSHFDDTTIEILRTFDESKSIVYFVASVKEVDEIIYHRVTLPSNFSVEIVNELYDATSDKIKFE